MRNAEGERAPKRITVTVPCELAAKIERKRAGARRKFGPMLVRLAELWLLALERGEVKEEMR